MFFFRKMKLLKKKKKKKKIYNTINSVYASLYNLHFLKLQKEVLPMGSLEEAIEGLKKFLRFYHLFRNPLFVI